MALPYDALFLASFAYAGYRTLGRWFKFAEDDAKARDDANFFESVNEVLERDAAAGTRGAGAGASTQLGTGAAASGQAHLWADWPRLRPEGRARLLEQMLQVLRLTGQDQRWRHLRKAKGDKWAQLTPAQRSELVWAADALDWSFVDAAVDAADAPPAGALIWQVTEPLPQLSEEPLRARGPRRDAAELRRLVGAEEAAVERALRAGAGAAAAKLAPPLRAVGVVEAAQRLAALREVLQGGLGLSSGGRAERGQRLMEQLRAFELNPAPGPAKALKEAALQELEEEVARLAAPAVEQASKDRAAAEARARALATAGVIQWRLRGAAGAGAGARVTPALAGALVALAASEVSERLAAAGPSGFAPAAAAEVMSVVALTGGALAALSSAVHDAGAADGGGGGAEPPADVEAAIELAERLQRAIERSVDKQGPAAAAAASTTITEGDEEEDNSAAAAVTAAADEAASLASDLRAAAARIASITLPGGADDGADDGSMEELVAEMQNDIATRVSESTAALAPRAEAAAENARDRERAAIVLRRARLIGAPDDAASPEAAAERPSAPVKRALYSELFLRQLGARSLGGALPDVTQFVEAVGGAEGLARGLELDAASADAARALERVVSEIALIDEVLRLDLGPGLPAAAAKLGKYLDGRAAADGDDGDDGDNKGDEGAEEGAAAPPAATPRAKTREAVTKARALLDELAGDALVALGLTAPQYRALAALREASGALERAAAGAATGDAAAAYERAAGAIKTAAAQLGDLGKGGGEAGDDAAGDDGAAAAGQALLRELRASVEGFLAFEANARGPAMAAVRALKAAADGASPSAPGAAGVGAAAAKAGDVEKQAAALVALLEALPGGGDGGGSAGEHAAALNDARAALSRIGEAAAALRGDLASYAAYSTLRERALATLGRAPGAPLPTQPGDGEGAAVMMELAEIEVELNAPLRVLADAEPEEQAKWEAAGNAAIARGHVAVALSAMAVAPGGLTADGGAGPLPRVLQPVPGLPSGKCCLQLFCERIVRAQALAASATHGASAPVTRPTQFFIMASPDTRPAIERALEKRRCYGLDRSQVHVFECAAAAPCLDADLKVVMSGPVTIATAPPGSGELLPELKASGSLRAAAASGARVLDIGTVDDNALWRPADAVFIGYLLSTRAAAAAKVVEPASVAPAYASLAAGFPGGAGAGADGGDAAELLDGAALQAPAIGAYALTLNAAERVAAAGLKDRSLGLRLVPARGIPKRGAPMAPPSLPPNLPPAARAQALAAAARAAEAAAQPRPVDGYALQRFLSDVLRGAGGDGAAPAPFDQPGAVALLAVPREEEFATVHSRGPHWAVAPPEAAAGRLLGLTTSWVEAAGGAVECEEGVEVSPLVSYAGEGLAALAGGVTFDQPYDAALSGGAGGAAAAAAGAPPHNAGALALPLAVAYGGAVALALAKSVARRGAA